MKRTNRLLAAAILVVAMFLATAADAEDRSSASNIAYTFIREHEGCSTSAYSDSAGVQTVGCGFTGRFGCGVQPGQVPEQLSQDRVDELFLCDLHAAEAVVRNYVRVPLNDNQFAALTSLAFNIGEVQFRDSTTVQLLNSGDYTAAADAMLRFVKTTSPITGVKEFSRGLERRRRDERALFLKLCT